MSHYGAALPKPKGVITLIAESRVGGRRERTQCNTLTDLAYRYMTGDLAPTPLSQIFSKMCVGFGTDPITQASTRLGDPILYRRGGKRLTRSYMSESGPIAVLETEVYFQQGMVVGDVSEVGFYKEFTGDNLTAGTLLTNLLGEVEAFRVSENDSLTVRYEIHTPIPQTGLVSRGIVWGLEGNAPRRYGLRFNDNLFLKTPSDILYNLPVQTENTEIIPVFVNGVKSTTLTAHQRVAYYSEEPDCFRIDVAVSIVNCSARTVVDRLGFGKAWSNLNGGIEDNAVLELDFASVGSQLVLPANGAQTYFTKTISLYFAWGEEFVFLRPLPASRIPGLVGGTTSSPIIQVDTSLSANDMVMGQITDSDILNLYQEGKVVPLANRILHTSSNLNTANTAAYVVGVEGSKVIGHSYCEYSRIPVAAVVGSDTKTIDGVTDPDDDNVTLAGILSSINATYNLSLDSEGFRLVVQAAGLYSVQAKETNPAWTGHFDVIDNTATSTIWLDGMRLLTGGEWAILKTLAYSAYGPPALGENINVNHPTLWELSVDSATGEFYLGVFGGESSLLFTYSPTDDEEVIHATLAFDPNGSPQVAFECDDDVIRVWRYNTNTSEFTVFVVGEGQCPYVIATGITSATPGSELLLVHYETNRLVYRRFVQSYSTAYELASDVLGLVCAQNTLDNRLIVYYVSGNNGAEPYLRNVATESLGARVGDVFTQSYTGEVTHFYVGEAVSTLEGADFMSVVAAGYVGNFALIGTEYFTETPREFLEFSPAGEVTQFTVVQGLVENAPRDFAADFEVEVTSITVTLEERGRTPGDPSSTVQPLSQPVVGFTLTVT